MISIKNILIGGLVAAQQTYASEAGKGSLGCHIVHPGRCSYSDAVGVYFSSVPLPMLNTRGGIESAFNHCKEELNLNYPKEERSLEGVRRVLDAQGTDGTHLVFGSPEGSPVMCKFSVPGEAVAITEVENFPKAERFLSDFIQGMTIETTIEEIVSKLKEFHAVLTDGISEAWPGQFRGSLDPAVHIFYDDTLGKSISNFVELLKQNNVKRKHIKHFKKVAKRGWEECDGDELCHKLAQRYIASTAARGDEVVPLMNDLADLLKEAVLKVKNGKECNVFKEAATQHQALVHAHPFKDGNGRTARLIVKTFLELAGYDFMPLAEDEVYMKYVNDDFRNPGEGWLAKFIQRYSTPIENQDVVEVAIDAYAE